METLCKALVPIVAIPRTALHSSVEETSERVKASNPGANPKTTKSLENPGNVAQASETSRVFNEATRGRFHSSLTGSDLISIGGRGGGVIGLKPKVLTELS